MAKLTPVLIDLIRRPDTNKTMSTVSEDGTPHSIVCGSILVPDPETICVGKIWMRTTGDNLERDPRAEFLVWSGRYAYSIVCDLVPSADDDKSLAKLNEELERKGMRNADLLTFRVRAVYDEGLSDNSGERII